jgi:ABC-2 type transport system permease protein
MRNIWIILKTEFKHIVSKKSYIIMTILGPFIIAGIFFLQYVSARGFEQENIMDKERTIKITGVSNELYNSLESTLQYMNITLINSNKSLEELKPQVQDEEIDGVLSFPNIKSDKDLLSNFSIEYYSLESSMFIQQILNNAIGEVIVRERLIAKNLDAMEIQALTKRPDITYKRLSKEGIEKEEDVGRTIFTLIGFIMILYMTIIFYGQSIGKTVNKEKTSKTVEIILSSVKPIELMIGKILGIGIAGVLQYSIWILMALFVTNFIFPIFDINLASFDIKIIHLIYLVIFFILAFLLYASEFAAVGASATEDSNLNQLAFPVMLPLILCMVFINLIITQPNSSLIVFFSYFPLTSPIIMLGRILMVNVPIWEILVCWVILLISVIGMAILASKVFRIGILMTGKKVNIKEIIKWLSYK